MEGPAPQRVDSVSSGEEALGSPPKEGALIFAALTPFRGSRKRKRAGHGGPVALQSSQSEGR